MKQDALRIRILGFLGDHRDHWYTIDELTEEISIAGTTSEIQHRLDALAKEGPIKERVVNDKKYYQANPVN
jgi:hypothetical protein